MNTSEYLQAKIRNFRGTIRFFRKRSFAKLVFLRQIEFWNWELDELLFSVSNFQERRHTWMKEPADLIWELENEGYCLSQKDKILRDLKLGRYGSEEYRIPLDEVNEVIDEWNDLIELVSRQLFDRQRIEVIRSSGGVAIDSLDRYRKKILESPG